MSTVKSAATKGATEALKKVTGHWAFWVVMAVIAAIIVWRSWNALSKWLENQRRVNRADTEGHQMTAEDRARVKALAQDLRTGIHSWSNSGRTNALTRAVSLNATELIFLADEYQAINDGVSLLQDLEDEITLPDVGKRLMARLYEVGVAKMTNPTEVAEEVTIQ